MAQSFAFNPFTGNFDILSTVTLAAVGSSPAAEGASISSAQVLTLQPASASFPGVVTTGVQSFAGVKTFTAATSIAPGAVGTPGLYLSTDTTTGLYRPGVNQLNIAAAGAIVANFGTSGLAITGLLSATGAVSGSNLSGTNTGDVTLTAVGAAPSANGATLSGQALTLQPADATHPGVLTAADWNTFNGKQAAGNYITALTGDVTASGPGSVAATIANNVVTDAKLRTSAGLSIVGRSANTTGNVADITGTAGQILRVSGTTLAFGSIDLAASAAVGATILTVPNGGTGLATLTANNVILGNGTSTPTFVAPSTTGNLLTSNGTTWTSAPAGATSVESVTGTTSITKGTTFCNASGGIFTATLPTAVGADGVIYRIKKTGTDFNIVTLATTSAQTIDGQTTRGLYTPNEEFTVQSDGANWRILTHLANFPMTTYTPGNGNGLGTPTFGNIMFGRTGDCIDIICNMTTGTVTAAEARVNLPNSWTVAGTITQNAIVGVWNRQTSSTETGTYILANGGQGYVTFGWNSSGVNGQTSQNGSTLFGNAQGVGWQAFRIPITGFTA